MEATVEAKRTLDPAQETLSQQRLRGGRRQLPAPSLHTPAYPLPLPHPHPILCVVYTRALSSPVTTLQTAFTVSPSRDFHIFYVASPPYNSCMSFAHPSSDLQKRRKLEFRKRLLPGLEPDLVSGLQWADSLLSADNTCRVQVAPCWMPRVAMATLCQSSQHGHNQKITARTLLFSVPPGSHLSLPIPFDT